MQLSVFAIVAAVLAVATAAAQDPTPVTPQSASRVSAIALGLSASGLSFATTASAGSRQPMSNASPGEFVAFTEGKPVRSNGIRRITLEQVKRSVNPATGPLARLGQLQIKAAKQHRLGVQTDYFPKFGAAFANLHYSEFLGEVLQVRRPILGITTQIPVPLFSQNQTIAALTFTQPITPLFMVNQAVRIARADERIAMAKAGVPVAKYTSDIDVEEAYFRLLIGQCQLTSAELKVRSIENHPLYAAASIEPVRASGQEPELIEAKKALVTSTNNVSELAATMNRMMGWPAETELELVPPDPLVESISLAEVADKSAAGNPDVIEAEQTVVKARAASAISKLEYVPTVAAVGGYLFQNAIPLVPSNFGYGGVIVSYNLFDFGKREHAVKEARAQLGMADIALQMTKAKVAANVKKSYYELERSRQLSQLAQKMGSSVGRLMNVSSTPESIEVKAARAKVDAEMLEADLAHRQAFARLKALMGPLQ
jgi:outer membrane protein TolC